MESNMNFQLALPTGSLETYIHSVNQIPMLGAEEEHELALRLRDHDDLAAARGLVIALCRPRSPRL